MGYHPSIVRRVLGVVLLVFLVAPGAVGGAAFEDRRVEVVVELSERPAAVRSLSARAPAVQAVAAAGRRLEARILQEVPSAHVRWRYRVVLAGLAVVVPARDVLRLRALPGVRAVYPSVRYRPLLNRTPGLIGAPAIWGPALATGGQGVKIGVIDDGLDASHRFFDPAGFSMPLGFPKGQRRFTTSKVIVARTFAPAGVTWRYARRPFDPLNSSHATHVAGIAAGNAGHVSRPSLGLPRLAGLSGVAPRAYLGNYKALTVPSEFGLNGNSPELVAAIEAAVNDGMDVINLSLGEPEIDPSRDIVAKALDNAAEAGVIPVVAAGNEFDRLGYGSVTSPGTSAEAITVAAVSGDRVFGTEARLTGPVPVPSELARFAGVPAGDVLAGAVSRKAQRLVPSSTVGDPTLCTSPSSAPANALHGAVLFATDGGCPLADKAAVAEGLGAAGAVVAVGRPRPFLLPPDNPLVPLLLVPKETGEALASFLASTATGEASVRFTDRPAEVVAGGAGVIVDFSSSGPTAFGLELKPDVSAPGLGVLSSLPRRQGPFGLLSGTSMAAPHVAGAAALLRQLHPNWTVGQVKSALVLTGRSVWTDPSLVREVPATRQGGGLVDVAKAASPLLAAEPQSLAFGLLDTSAGPQQQTRTLALSDVGGGAGVWNVSVAEQTATPSVAVVAPASVTVPGELTVTVAIEAGAEAGDRTGFVVLEKDGERRRLPFWLLVARSEIGSEPSRPLPRPGTYVSDTRGGKALVDRYRYPDRLTGGRRLRGPERVFTLGLRRPVANAGVAVVEMDRGVDVEPRIALAASENRLAGSGALPYVSNPYLDRFSEHVRSAGLLRPSPGRYWIVFDGPSRRSAGRFTFRLWVDDVTPPAVSLRSRAAEGGILVAEVRDEDAGVDETGVLFAVDGGPFERARYDESTGRAILDVRHLPPGRHRVVIMASDRQEAKNTENAGLILPNTTFVRTAFRAP